MVDLRKATRVHIPVMRKEFIVDAYQLFAQMAVCMLYSQLSQRGTQFSGLAQQLQMEVLLSADTGEEATCSSTD